jgi:muramidase (phage lysozyme)
MADNTTFTPRARPVDTVGVQTRLAALPTPVAPVRPQAPEMAPLPAMPVKSNTDQLVSALAGFGKSLGTFMDTRQAKQNKDDETEAELTAIRDNVATWSEAVRSDPSLADKSPYFRQMYEARVARTKVQTIGFKLLAEYQKNPIAGSDDPTVIQKFLSDGFKPVIDGATHAAERDAMLDEVNRVSRQFTASHAKNAVQNLNYRNAVSYGQSVDGTFTEAAVKGGTAAYKTADPVAKDLKPHEAALLNGIAGGESAGKYNVRYTPSGGATFQLTGMHPGIYEPGPDGPSSAAGRYQFVKSTWDSLPAEAKGDGTFSPENQDRAALWLARRDYRKATGGDLDADLQNEGFSPRIQKALAPTWQALKGNHGRHAETYRATATRYAEGGGGDASGVFTLARSIHRQEAEGVAQGMAQSDIDSRTVDSAISAAMRYRDATYLDVPLQKRPNGQPGAGEVPGMRDKLDQARKQLHALRVKEEDETYRRQERDEKRRSDKATQFISEQLYEALDKGDVLKLPPALLARINKDFGNDTAEKVLKIQKTLSDYQGQEDSREVIRLEMEANENRLSDTDLHKAIETGTLKNPETIRRLLKTQRENRDSSLLADRTVVDILQDVAKIVGDRGEFGVFKKPAEAQRAVDSLRRAVIEYERKNPAKTRSEVISWLMDEQRKVTAFYAPKHKYNTTPDYDGSTPVMPTPAKSGVTPPSPAAAPAKPASPSPAASPQATRRGPAEEVDWRTTPVYESLAALEADNANRRNPSSHFARWAKDKGFSPEDAAAFISIQRSLLSRRPGQ